MNRLGIIADTHDHLINVRKAIDLFIQRKVVGVIHCGDVVAQFVLKEFSRLPVPLTLVFGNCDGDREALQQMALTFGCRCYEGPATVELFGRRISVSHQPLASVPACDFYLHGHTHRQRYESGPPVIINPGEACGWLTGTASVAILDIETGEVDFCEWRAGQAGEY
ncbi:MAG: metallophosphoesterase [candidate division WOR-3 bacterium]|jgi:putative phosphoesterase